MALKTRCADLTSLLTKTLVSFCEINVSFERKLEVLGSVHVRSDTEEVVSFLLNEVVEKETSPVAETRNEPPIAHRRKQAVPDHVSNCGREHAQVINVPRRQEHRRLDTMGKSPNIVEVPDWQKNSNKRTIVKPYWSQSLQSTQCVRDIVHRTEKELESHRSDQSIPQHGSPDSLTHDRGSPLEVTENSGTAIEDFRRQGSLIKSARSRLSWKETIHIVDDCSSSNSSVKDEHASVEITPAEENRDLSASPLILDVSQVKEELILETNQGLQTSDQVAGDASLHTPPLLVTGGEGVMSSTPENDKDDSNSNMYGYINVPFPISGPVPAVSASNGDTYTMTDYRCELQREQGQSVIGPARSVSLANIPRRRFAEKTYSCTYCGKKFGSKVQLKVHESRWHQQPQRWQAKSADQSSQGLSQCQTCLRNFTTKQGLVAHQSKCPGECKCIYCYKVFKSGIHLSNHVRQEHQQQQFSCSVCNAVLKSKDSLNCHMNSRHIRKRKYFCKTCDKVFYSRQNLHGHKTRVHGYGSRHDLPVQMNATF